MSDKNRLPPGSLAAAADAIGEVAHFDRSLRIKLARAALEAGRPFLERRARADAAERIMTLTGDSDLYDTHYATQRYLKMMKRGEALPEKGSQS